MRLTNSILPGLGLLGAIGLAARVVASIMPLSRLIVAIFIGLVIGNVYGIPQWATDGVETNKLWLEAGIVVMGANIALGHVIAVGPTIIVLVIATVVLTIVSVEVLSREVFGIRDKIGSLLAAGSGICGVSAVVTIAGSIEADEKQIAYAAATVLLFDTITLLAYPIIGHVLGLSDIVFGLWTGLTMFSTGTVTAAGFAFSNTAGKWAVLVKLTRNALIGVAAIGYALYYIRKPEETERTAQKSEENEKAGHGSWSYLWESFPKFVLGFLAVMLIANTGILTHGNLASLDHASNWLFLFAFAGLGLEIRIDELRSTGLRPVLVVLISLIGVSSLCLLVLTTIF